MGSQQGALCPTPPLQSECPSPPQKMDLSGNICGCCCTVFPRAVLSPVDKEEEEELVALVVGSSASKSKLLTCRLCRTQLTAFAHFLRVARGNIAKLRQVHEEQQVDQMKGERKSPDTTWPSIETDRNPRLEISVRDSPSPPITWSRDNTVTIVALEDSQAKEAAAREANRVRNVRYRERKRAKEAEMRGYISCVAVHQGDEEPVETIDVTPDLSITMEEEEEDLGRQEAVSPPPCHLPPILVPSSTPSCFPAETNPNLYQASEVDPEERRRRRNREASRRYRERARGDPELLRRMREQQNRRQKKYYARLKEKKQGSFQEGPDFEGLFPIRGGRFDSCATLVVALTNPVKHIYSNTLINTQCSTLDV